MARTLHEILTTVEPWAGHGFLGYDPAGQVDYDPDNYSHIHFTSEDGWGTTVAIPTESEIRAQEPACEAILGPYEQQQTDQRELLNVQPDITQVLIEELAQCVDLLRRIGKGIKNTSFNDPTKENERLDKIKNHLDEIDALMSQSRDPGYDTGATGEPA